MRTPSYTAEEVQDHGATVVRLKDARWDVEVFVIPAVGNRAYRMLVNGANILHFPSQNPNDLKTDTHLSGIPFLAPWANRMPGGFFANGRRYLFHTESASIRADGNGIPIHGLLTASPFWKVSEITADSDGAWVTSRLEFWRYPELMSNWPIAHEYEMTYRLREGALEVSIAVINRSFETMPVAVGFHPYFVLPGVPIADAVARIPVTSHVETDNRLVATGELKPVDFESPLSLRERRFDDGFTGLAANDKGQAVFSVEGAGRKIEVVFGPKYTVAIVYAPAGQDYICFEPMTAVTNGINLASEGKYAGLQSIEPGGRWAESFWIRPSGFNTSV
ncbi:MAG: aldose 1-epimerase [Acidobacteriota bacterium]|nr:aldose 1-epimerase [Acidobacteriota bacterium]